MQSFTKKDESCLNQKETHTIEPKGNQSLIFSHTQINPTKIYNIIEHYQNISPFNTLLKSSSESKIHRFFLKNNKVTAIVTNTVITTIATILPDQLCSSDLFH